MLTCRGTIQQIIHLCGEKVLKPLCDLLAAEDKIVSVVLDGIANILAAAKQLEEDHIVVNWLEAVGGYDKIEKLKTAEDEGVRYKALKIWEEYLEE